jgi:hypothetical protein
VIRRINIILNNFQIKFKSPQIFIKKYETYKIRSIDYFFNMKFKQKSHSAKYFGSEVTLTKRMQKKNLYQGWPTRGPRAACNPEGNFCGPILDWNSVIFRYFEFFSIVFVKNWPKKSIFLEIFPNTAQRPIWVGHPWSI